MSRIRRILVLLLAVVLVSSLTPGVDSALAGDPDAIERQDDARGDVVVVGQDGTPDDNNPGDPGSAGDGLGCKDDLFDLGDSYGVPGADEIHWQNLIIMMISHIQLVP